MACVCISVTLGWGGGGESTGWVSLPSAWPSLPPETRQKLRLTGVQAQAGSGGTLSPERRNCSQLCHLSHNTWSSPTVGRGGPEDDSSVTFVFHSMCSHVPLKTATGSGEGVFRQLHRAGITPRCNCPPHTEAAWCTCCSSLQPVQNHSPLQHWLTV